MFLSLQTKKVISMKCLNNNNKTSFMTTSQKYFKKTPTKLETSINLEDKNIPELINLDVPNEYMARASAFITLTVHKADFRQSPSCRTWQS